MRRTTGAILIETRPADRRGRPGPRAAPDREASPASPPVEGPPPPDIGEPQQQQDDENDDLDEDEDRVRALQDHPDRVQEDDLDVEEDEQHRHHVEADPEAEGLRHLARQSALVRLVLDLVRPPRADQPVQRRQGRPRYQPEAGEDDHWEVAAQHGGGFGSPRAFARPHGLEDATAGLYT